jgi:hypothetical protein
VTTTASGVLLIDVENMVGQRAKPATIGPRMDVMLRCVGPGVVAVAACASSRITAAGAEALQERGVALLSVSGSKDAADKALLAEARRWSAQGRQRFIAASNDSSFAQLAELGDLEILVWETQTTNKKYVSRAARVHRVRLPSTAPAASPAGAPAGGVPEHRVAGSRSDERTGATGPPTHAGSPPPPMSSPPLSAAARRLAQERPGTPGPATKGAIALGIFAAGVIFGVGAAVGELTTRTITRPTCRRCARYGVSAAWRPASTRRP